MRIAFSLLLVAYVLPHVMGFVEDFKLVLESGAGTRVVEPRVKSGVGAWQSFTREMEAKGIKVEIYSSKVRLVPANAIVRYRCTRFRLTLSLRQES